MGCVWRSVPIILGFGGSVVGRGERCGGAWCGVAFVGVVFLAVSKYRVFVEVCVPCLLRFLDSIVVSIPACHAGDPGSIPGRGALFCHTKHKRPLFKKHQNDIHTSSLRACYLPTNNRYPQLLRASFIHARTIDSFSFSFRAVVRQSVR